MGKNKKHYAARSQISALGRALSDPGLPLQYIEHDPFI